MLAAAVSIAAAIAATSTTNDEVLVVRGEAVPRSTLIQPVPFQSAAAEAETPTPKDPGSMQYSDQTARQISLYASAAYCSPYRVSSWQLDRGCADLNSFEIKRIWSVDSSIFRRSENAGFAYVGVDHARKWVVASFKGTNDTVDWMHDLQGLEFSFDPCRLPSGNTRGTVHKGFCEYYVKLAKLGVAGNFTALMEKHSDYTPVMTGHSLGGAAAALMAYDVYEYSRGRAAALLYTYGMPRVGDFEFAKALNARVANAYRIVHARDIVPHLPPCVGLLGCSQGKAMPHHTATEVFYPNAMRSGDNFTICDGSGEDSHCSNGVAHISVSDHCSYFGINNCAICCREEASHNFVSSPAGSFLKLLFT